MGADYDFLFKIVLLGHAGVGKTIILHKYKSYNNGVTWFQYYLPIVGGIEMETKRLELESKKIELHIWNPAGQERFHTLTKAAYIRSAHGVVLVFDVADERSFEVIQEWLKYLAQLEDKKEKVLLGNKSDLTDTRRVTKGEAQRLAETFNVDYFEVSCKTNMNIDEPFRTLTKKILNNFVTKEIGVGAGTEPQFPTNEKIGVGAGTEPQFQRDEKIGVGAGTESQFPRNEKIGVGAGTEPQFQRNEKIGVGAGTEPQFQTIEKIGVGAGTEQRLQRKEKVEGGKISKCKIQ